MLLVSQPFWFYVLPPVLGVVLWIHRTSKSQQPQIKFGGMRFIQKVQRQYSRPSRLQRLLLLLLRMLFMTLLLTAFSNPIWKSEVQFKQKHVVTYILDATASMQRRMGRSSVWELTHKMAVNLLAEHSDQPVMVYLLDDQLHSILPEPSLNHAYLASVIRQAKPSFAHHKFLPVLDQIPSIYRINIHVFTDAQQSQFPALEDWKNLMGEHTCIIHAINDKPRSNLSLINLKWQRGNEPFEKQGELQIELFNDSLQQQDADLSFFFDNHLYVKHKERLTPKQQKKIKIRLMLPEGNATFLRVEINNNDAIAWDNAMAIILPKPIDYSVLKGDQNNNTKRIARLFEKWGYKQPTDILQSQKLLIITDGTDLNVKTIKNDLDQSATVLWCLTDQQSADIYSKRSKEEGINHITPTWQKRQTRVPEYWRWTWDDPWLDVFAGPYSQVLNRISSSQNLTWVRFDKSNIRILASVGQTPVIWTHAMGNGHVIVLAIAMQDLTAMLKEPAILAAFLHLGHQTVQENIPLTSLKKNNINFLWSPEVSNLSDDDFILFSPSESQTRWDKQPVVLNLPGVYSIKSKNKTMILDQVAVRVDAAEYDSNQINVNAYTHYADQTKFVKIRHRRSIWPWLILCALGLFLIEGVLLKHLRIKEKQLAG